MRQILIIKGEDENLLIVNLSDNDTCSISFSKERCKDDKYSGFLYVYYSTRRLRISMKFRNKDDALEFEDTLLEYIRNASIPFVSEDNKTEIRYWMEFEVLEVQDVYS